MIFLCFSGKDRMTIVQSILYHLKNYGLDVWYDNYEYIIGDNKTANFTKAIIESKYAIVIFSKHFPNSPGAIEELAVIKSQYNKGLIHIFPIFYNICATDIPSDYQWLTEMIYNELTEKTGTLLTCNQILCKFLEDTIIQKDFIKFDLSYETNFSCDIYVKELLTHYTTINSANINSKLTILSCIIIYIRQKIDLPFYILKSSSYLLQIIKLGLNYNFKEIIILELLVIICINIQNSSNSRKI